MKRLIFFCSFLLIILATKAQVPQDVGSRKTYVRVPGSLWVDSLFRIPKQAPSASWFIDSGSLYYNKADSAIYVYRNSQWVPVVKSVNDTTLLVNGDTVTVGGTGGGGAADGNNYPTSVTYDASTRVLTINRSGLSAITVTLPLATTTDPGLMAAADKARIDSLGNGTIADSLSFLQSGDTLFACVTPYGGGDSSCVVAYISTGAGTGDTAYLIGQVTYTHSGTESTTFTNATLIGKTILSVMKFPNVINLVASGPASDEVAVNPTTGEVTFGTALQNGETVVITYSYKSTAAVVDTYSKVDTVTTDATLNGTYHTVLIDATSNNVTITLPAATSVFSAKAGINYLIKRIDSSAFVVKIQGTGGELMDGLANYFLTTQYQAVSLQSANTGYIIY